MVFSGMLRRVALVRTDVSEEYSASFIRVTRIGELETTLAAFFIVTAVKTSNLTKFALLLFFPIEERREILKSYIFFPNI
jgi:hypothetical protein